MSSLFDEVVNYLCCICCCVEIYQDDVTIDPAAAECLNVIVTEPKYPHDHDEREHSCNMVEDNNSLASNSTLENQVIYRQENSNDLLNENLRDVLSKAGRERLLTPNWNDLVSNDDEPIYEEINVGNQMAIEDEASETESYFSDETQDEVKTYIFNNDGIDTNATNEQLSEEDESLQIIENPSRNLDVINEAISENPLVESDEDNNGAMAASNSNHDINESPIDESDEDNNGTMVVSDYDNDSSYYSRNSNVFDENTFDYTENNLNFFSNNNSAINSDCYQNNVMDDGISSMHVECEDDTNHNDIEEVDEEREIFV